MARRRFLAQLATWPLAALLPMTTFPEHRSAPRKIVLKSAWGSDDPPLVQWADHIITEQGRDDPARPDPRNAVPHPWWVRLICAGDVEALERAA